MSYPNFSYYNVPSVQNNFLSSAESAVYQSMAKANMASPWPSSFTPATPLYSNNVQTLPQRDLYVPKVNKPSEVTTPRHEVMEGIVTQLFSNFGYINDDIIFSISDVTGPMVKVGDKVAVDTTFQPNNPTKYKGERVCKIVQSRFAPIASSTYEKMKTLTNVSSTRLDLTSNNRSTDNYSTLERNHIETASKESNSRKIPVHKRLSNKSNYNPGSFDVLSGKRDVDVKVSERRSKNTHKTVQRNVINLIKSTSLKRLTEESEVLKINPQNNKKQSVSPIIDKKARISPINSKYESKTIYESKSYENFASREYDSALVNLQCQTLTVPSEFFHASLKYQQSFPLNHPLKLGNSCNFKIMDKQVKSIDSTVENKLNNYIDPEDAITTYVVKVMLLSTDGLAKFYKDTLPVAEDYDSRNKIPITKAIKFLVGSIGENKEFGIGGAWSPSLDGQNPESNPRVLINTAIRTCKSITGIDLSNCSSWPKFLELHYYRPQQKICCMQENNETVIDLDDVSGKAKYKEPRMETVVYFLPDVWNCMPDQDSWNEISRLYHEQLTSVSHPLSMSTTTKSVNQISLANGSEISTDRSQEKDEKDPETEDIADISKNSEHSFLDVRPTHYSKLSISSMKIVEIKNELELRKLNNRGVMEQLKARLKGAIEREENEEKNKALDAEMPTKTTMPIETIPVIRLLENEKNDLKLQYTLSDQPHIIVHQNRKLFSNQMKIRTMSLHSLLSYYDTSLQESTFELALFAKQFFAMLRRDAVFNIYKSLVVAQETDFITEESTNKAMTVTTTKRTVNKPLLFSCTLLDREQTNRISIQDLKVLIEGLGIFLSSNQLFNVIGKIKGNSTSFNYRQLTDKEMSETDILSYMKVDTSDDMDYIKELALGNKALFECETHLSLDSQLRINCEEIERLRNELNKSERYRQSIELKISEIKDETEKNIKVSQLQTKEIEQLKDKTFEYKTKYESEQSKGDQYKLSLEKLLRQMQDIDKVAKGLSRNVSDSLDKYIADSNRIENSTTKLDNNVTKTIIKPIIFDLTDGSSMITRDAEGNGGISERVMCNITTTSLEDDFELSKPSDYDMIVLEDIE